MAREIANLRRSSKGQHEEQSAGANLVTPKVESATDGTHQFNAISINNHDSNSIGTGSNLSMVTTTSNPSHSTVNGPRSSVHESDSANSTGNAMKGSNHNSSSFINRKNLVTERNFSIAKFLRLNVIANLMRHHQRLLLTVAESSVGNLAAADSKHGDRKIRTILSLTREMRSRGEEQNSAKSRVLSILEMLFQLFLAEQVRAIHTTLFCIAIRLAVFSSLLF